VKWIDVPLQRSGQVDRIAGGYYVIAVKAPIGGSPGGSGESAT